MNFVDYLDNIQVPKTTKGGVAITMPTMKITKEDKSHMLQQLNKPNDEVINKYNEIIRETEKYRGSNLS